MVIYDFMTLFPVIHGNTLGVLKNPWIITENQAVEASRAFSRGLFAALTCPGFNSLLSSPFCLMNFGRSLARSVTEWIGMEGTGCPLDLPGLFWGSILPVGVHLDL